MEFKNARLLPGEVTAVVNTNGVIKANVMSLFNEDDPELLPPLYPFIQPHTGSFSSPKVGDKIWAIYENTNKQNLYYIKLHQLPHKELVVEESPNVEILMSREVDKGLYQIFFNDGTGIKLSKDDSFICIKPDDSIVIRNMEHAININANGISLGTEGGSKYSAVLGEKNQEVIEQICLLFKSIASAAVANPYTSPIATTINSILPGIEKQLESILSDTVTLD